MWAFSAAAGPLEQGTRLAAEMRLVGVAMAQRGIKGPGVITVEPVSNRSSGGTGAGAGSGTTKSDGIPGLAEGGIVKARPGGTLIRAGEARRDEAVVPLPEHGLLGGGSLTVIVEGSIVGDAGVRQLLDEWWWARQSEARGNR